MNDVPPEQRWNRQHVGALLKNAYRHKVAEELGAVREREQGWLMESGEPSTGPAASLVARDELSVVEAKGAPIARHQEGVVGAGIH
jgi:hypothetical protein